MLGPISQIHQQRLCPSFDILKSLPKTLLSAMRVGITHPIQSLKNFSIFIISSKINFTTALTVSVVVTTLIYRKFLLAQPHEKPKEKVPLDKDLDDSSFSGPDNIMWTAGIYAQLVETKQKLLDAHRKFQEICTKLAQQNKSAELDPLLQKLQNYLDAFSKKLVSESAHLDAVTQCLDSSKDTSIAEPLPPDTMAFLQEKKDCIQEEINAKKTAWENALMEFTGQCNALIRTIHEEKTMQMIHIFK